MSTNRRVFRTPWTIFGHLCMAIALSGCAGLEQEQNETRSSLEALSNELGILKAQNEKMVNAIKEDLIPVNTQLKEQSEQVSRLQESVAELPRALTSLCPKPTIATASCDSEGLRRVVISGDKMVVGELERVWLDPPGVSLTARVDTGAFSNSLNAEGLVEFERDGDDWVRFFISQGESEAQVTVERKVLRWVRVFQQADRQGSRRPMVKMRLLLGDVAENFEFTLADRSHLEYQVLLGRNFLTDIALVDVGRQFVQPPFLPKND